MAGTPLVSGTLAQQGGKVVPVATQASQTAAKETTLVQRAKALAQWLWTGKTPAETWFGPGQPLTPVAPQEVEGRMRDFPQTANLEIEPRAEEATRFWELYALADSCDLVRLCIETRKDQLARQKWTVRKREATAGKKYGAEQPDLIEFFKSPDRLERYQQWQGRILEDLFVGDCASIYVRRALNGDIFGFEPIDGSTILLRLDPWGRVPRQGEAYTQILKGLPAVPYSRDQLIYAPRRPRNQKGYGLSCVEQIIITVNVALRRQAHQLSYYTDGSSPDLIVGVPKDWSEKAINILREYWESHFRGNSRERRGHPLIVVGGNECKFEDTKKEALKDEFDEWLARVICFCFSLPPTPFIRQSNRATAETAQETALSEGLAPIMEWWKDLVDDMLRRLGRPDCEFSFVEEEAIDPLVRAQIHQIYNTIHVLTVNDIRNDLGKDPLPDGDKFPEPPAPPPGKPGAPAPNAAAPKPADAAPKAGAGQKSAIALMQTIHKNRDAVVKGLAKALTTGTHKKALPSRNREDLLKTEAAFALKVAKELSAIRKVAAGRIRAASHKLAKDVGEPLANLVTDDDFKRLHGLVQVQAQDTYQQGVAAAGAVIDATTAMTRLANESAVAWAKDHAAEQVTEISETTRKGVGELVSQAVTEGWSNADLADRLEEEWEFGIDRAALIAATETAMADLAGNVEICREAGVQIVEWLAADANACDQCEDLDGQQAPIDGEFPDGTKADDIAHPGCRCDRLAVLPNESEESA